jgi:tetratricopeptide (TPR) repeat protein
MDQAIVRFIVGFFLIALAVTAPAADPDDALSRMRDLLGKHQAKELTVEFEKVNFSEWPSSMADKTAEALQMRGRAYLIVKDGRQAEVDLKQALSLAPKNAAIWITLGENYLRNLDNNAQALAAFDEVRRLRGASQGWENFTATLFSVQILTDQLQTDEAIALLEPLGDLSNLPTIWRIKMLRAYGHIYASQGKEPESLAKFREALQLESEAK